MDKVKAEIERMKANNIIEETTEGTDWCAGTSREKDMWYLHLMICWINCQVQQFLVNLMQLLDSGNFLLLNTLQN